MVVFLQFCFLAYFLVDSLFLLFVLASFKESIDVSMSTICAVLLANFQLFLLSLILWFVLKSLIYLQFFYVSYPWFSPVSLIFWIILLSLILQLESSSDGFKGFSILIGQLFYAHLLVLGLNTLRYLCFVHPFFSGMAGLDRHHQPN